MQIYRVYATVVSRVPVSKAVIGAAPRIPLPLRGGLAPLL